MGQKKSKLNGEELIYWAKQLRMEKEAVQEKYQSLASKNEITKADFKEAYQQFFPK